AAVHPGDPRARLLAVPLHQRHDGHGRAAARLLRRRQYRENGGVQPGADGAARAGDRCCHMAGEGQHERRYPLGMMKPNDNGRTIAMTKTLPAFALAAVLATPALAQNFGPPELIAAAKKEGKLVYYTANFAEVEQEVIKAFNKR